MNNLFGSYLKEFLEFNNISINEFAERIGTSSKNLIDILNGQISLSQNMIYNISFVTDIPVSMIENLELSFRLEKNINEYLNKNNITITQLINKYNYKELKDKYNVTYTNEKNKIKIMEDIMKYLRISDINILTKDNSILYKSKNDKPELLALWLERCYRITLNQTVGEYDKKNINILVDYIKEQAKNNIFNEQELINKFNQNGIYLVIEDDLSGSKIRGAFKVLKNKPAIFITKKHKRYADIYFSLLHELAHCKSDYNRAKNGSIVSNFDDIDTEDYELKADSTAFNWMVDEKLYEIIKKNIINIDKYDCIKSFVVYRLANDKIISYSSKLYQINNGVLF